MQRPEALHQGIVPQYTPRTGAANPGLHYSETQEEAHQDQQGEGQDRRDEDERTLQRTLTSREVQTPKAHVRLEARSR